MSGKARVPVHRDTFTADDDDVVAGELAMMMMLLVDDGKKATNCKLIKEIIHFF